jgi:death on curing protein
MSEPVWLSVQDILALHALQVGETGGDPGMRDARRLESAAERPRNLHAYGAPTWGEMAAAYATGIIQGHPFVDGNKRTGFATAAVFLIMNGRRLRASEPEATIKVLGLAAGEVDEATFARWMDSRIVVSCVEEPAPPRRTRKAKSVTKKPGKSKRRR